MDLIRIRMIWSKLNGVDPVRSVISRSAVQNEKQYSTLVNDDDSWKYRSGTMHLSEFSDLTGEKFEKLSLCGFGRTVGHLCCAHLTLSHDHPTAPVSAHKKHSTLQDAAAERTCDVGHLIPCESPHSRPLTRPRSFSPHFQLLSLLCKSIRRPLTSLWQSPVPTSIKA